METKPKDTREKLIELAQALSPDGAALLITIEEVGNEGKVEITSINLNADMVPVLLDTAMYVVSQKSGREDS